MLKFKNQLIDEVTEEGIVKGYGSIFGNIDSDRDVIVKGAYTKTLNENKSRLKFLWQHKMDSPIGKFIDIAEDDKGVPFSAKISDTKLGQDAKILIKDGVINEFSVGFIPIKEQFNKEEGVNYIKEVKLFEISLVTLAANDAATLTDYKSLTVEDLMNDFDSLIKTSKKLLTSDTQRIIEFELLKLKDMVHSVNRMSSEEKDTALINEVESKMVALEIEKFLKTIK